MTPIQVKFRRRYFAEYVSAYLRAFGCRPEWHEFRALFEYATRKALMRR